MSELGVFMKKTNKHQTKSVILLLIFFMSLTSITIITSENNSNIIKAKDDKAALKTSDPSTYVIITTNAIESNSDNLSDFVIYKESLGFSVEVITEDEFGLAEGQIRVINIRNWLISNYVSKNIEYVLLIGDPDPDDYGDGGDSIGDVPMLMCYPRRGEGLYEESPTDYIYADLSGDWDTDSDGYYGEYSQDYNVDFEAEVYVGRIPVYSADYTSLDNVLKRIINHHDNAGTEKKNILLPMAISNYWDEDYSFMERTDGLDCPEYVWENIASPMGMSDTVMYERSGLSPVPTNAFHYDMALTKNNFITEFNTGQGAVLWWGHGNETATVRKYWDAGKEDGDGIPESDEMTWDPFIESIDMLSLENDQPAFFYQSSCLNGMPEDSDNLGYALLKRGAAISTVSASRVSWYMVGDWSPLQDYADNTGIGFIYMYYLLEDEMTNGEALFAAKDIFWNNWDAESWMNKMDFNLYGDPSMYYWWESPPLPISSSSSGGGGGSSSTSSEDLDVISIFLITAVLVGATVATTIIIITKKKGKSKERDIVPPPSYPPPNQPPENPPDQDITYQTTVNLFCTNCGEEFQPNSSFCTKCGSKRLN